MGNIETQPVGPISLPPPISVGPRNFAEVASSGLVVEGLFGIEAPGWILADIDARLNDARQRGDLLRIARLLESEPSVLGISAHLLVVARKHRRIARHRLASLAGIPRIIAKKPTTRGPRGR
jgi:hypothetical protein